MSPGSLPPILSPSRSLSVDRPPTYHSEPTPSLTPVKLEPNDQNLQEFLRIKENRKSGDGRISRFSENSIKSDSSEVSDSPSMYFSAIAKILNLFQNYFSYCVCYDL